MTRTTSCAALACRTLSSGLTACRHYLFFLISLVLFHASASAGAALDRTVSLDIAPNSALDDALIQWGAQTGMQIMMDTNTVGHERTSGMRGTFRADDALSALLRTSGLWYQVSDATVTVISAAKGDAKRKLFGTTERLTSDSPAENRAGPESSEGSESGPPTDSHPDKKKETKPVALEEIVVTGTHIAG